MTELQVQDIVVLAQAVDLACQKGAFSAAQMADVGTAYNKVMKALAEQVEKAKAESEVKANKKEKK